MVPQLPPETLAQIIDLAAGSRDQLDYTTIRHLCLTSRMFLPCARKVLYREIRFERLEEFLRIVGTLTKSSQLAKHATSLHFLITDELDGVHYDLALGDLPDPTTETRLQPLCMRIIAALCPNMTRVVVRTIDRMDSDALFAPLLEILPEIFPALKELDFPLSDYLQDQLALLPASIKTFTAGWTPSRDYVMSPSSSAAQPSPPAVPLKFAPTAFFEAPNAQHESTIPRNLLSQLAEANAFDHLRSLSVSTATLASPTFAQQLPHFRAVEQLRVHVYPSDTESADPEQVIDCISKLPSLRYLTIASADSVAFAPYLRDLPLALKAIRLDCHPMLSRDFKDFLDYLRTSPLSRIQITRLAWSSWVRKMKWEEYLQEDEDGASDNEPAKPFWEELGWEAFEGAGVVDLVRSV